MNSYFATCEQMSNPALRGKPIGVGGSNLERTVVTAASYEAKRFGVKVGMSIFEAKRFCPKLIVVVGDPEKYVDTTTKFLKVFQAYSPDLEIFSIDEAFLDVTRTHERFGGPVALAKIIKNEIRKELGELFTISVGISYNKTLAKLAASKMKPDGLVWIKRQITEEDRRSAAKIMATKQALAESRLIDICGIGSRIERALLNMGVTSLDALARMTPERLRKRFGLYGIFLYNIAHGEDPSPVVPYWLEDPYRSMGHHYTIPKDIHSREELEPLLLKFSEKIGRRLRAHGYRGRTIHLLLRNSDLLDLSQQQTLSEDTDDGYEIYKAAGRILDQWVFPESVRMLGISCSHLVKNYQQLSLLNDALKRTKVLEAMDQVNDRYGEFTVMRARLLKTKLKVHVGGFVEDRAKTFKQFGVTIKK